MRDLPQLYGPAARRVDAGNCRTGPAGQTTRVGAAFATAAIVGLGNSPAAYADDTASAADQGYSILFGGDGTDPGVTAAQAANNEALDVQLYDENSGLAGSFDTSAVAFEAGNDHALENLIYAVDPSAFSIQTTDGIDGLMNAAGGYLVPEDSLAYLATSLDFFLLTPTGVDYLLSPVAEILLGSPPF